MNEENKKNKEFKLDIKYIALIFVIAVIACIATAGATLSRYVTQTNAYFDDGKEVHEYLDFTVNSVFEVRNQMELFAAINQGYSFIRLSQDIENPLIVTQNAETLDSDLILDLNGIEIQRNGYQPILNIQPGVRLTVVDTSDEGTGGLYNPVGSVFNITGGVLTIATGHFESGPRYSEYYSYNTEVIREDDALENKRTIVLPDEQRVHFHQGVKGADGKYSYGNSMDRTAPIIRSYPLDVGNITYTHGNLYFDKAYDGATLDIPVDTYVYYRTSEDVIDGKQEMIELSCDWYYMYWVDPDFNYLCAEESELVNFADRLAANGYTVDDCVEIAIYGYENVIEEASKIPAEKDYYAAIQMSSGTLEVKDGQFFSYFGVPTTACVNAIGGEINVVKGKFSSRIPNATEQVVNATERIDKKHEDVDAFGTAYFDKYNWNTTDANGALAMAGESYCILNSGNADVSIGDGDFRSSNNNIVAMKNGDLQIGTGNFTKQSTIDASANTNSHAAMIYVEQGTLNINDATAAVSGKNNVGIMMENGTLTFKKATSFSVDGDNAIGIRMTAGTLTVSDAAYSLNGKNAVGVYMNDGILDVERIAFDITGDSSSGIRMLDGTMTIDDANCNISGADTYGIYSTVSGQDSFVVNNASFTLTGGNYQTGIYAENGRVQVTGTTAQTINLSGGNSYGIHVENGGSVLSTGYSYEVDGANSYGIFSTDGAVNVSNGNITMGGATSDGIHSVTGPIDFTNGNVTLSGASSNGIYCENATINVTNGNMTLNGATSKGINSTGGNITMTGGGITLTSNQTCYGVYAASNVVTTDLNVSIDNADIRVGYIENNTAVASKTGTHAASIGVFLTSANPNNAIRLNNSSIYSYEVGVALRGGNLYFSNGADIMTNYASAVAITGGNLEFDANGTYNLTSNNTRAFSQVNTTTTNYNTNAYTLTIPIFSGDTLTAEEYVNTDGVYVSGGKFKSYGTLNVVHSGLQNDTVNTRTYYTQAVTSYAIRVDGMGSEVTVAPSDANNSTFTVTARAGGGLYCGSGRLTVGTEDSPRNAANNTVTIQTTGQQSTTATYHGTGGSNGTGWNVPLSITGGNAVELNGGSITIYTGVYDAAFGNGILAKIPSGSTGTMDVYNGVFTGDMKGKTGSFSGPASSYGIKVIGGATVNLYDGKYDGRAGGVMITGADTFNRYYNTVSGTTANLYIHAGTYASTNATDGIMVYELANVVIGAKKTYGDTRDDVMVNKDKITISAKLCPISCNTLTFNMPTTQRSNVEVYYGTMVYGQSIVYNENSDNTNYSSSYIKFYNRNHTDGNGVAVTAFDNFNGNTGDSNYNAKENKAYQYIDETEISSYVN